MDQGILDLALVFGTALAVFVVIVGFWMAFRDDIMDAYEQYADTYRRTFVLELQFPDNPPLVLGGYVAATIAIFALLVPSSPILALLVPVAAYFIPQAYYEYAKVERRKKIDDVLPNVLQQLGANTKNIGSISLALQEVAKTAPVPMDYELDLISRQEQELKSFSKALNNARSRIQSQWFDVVTAVLVTAEEKGGKVSAAMQNLSRTFVQLKAMQAKIDTATSQGRTSMKVMLAMPFVVVAIVYAVDPDLVGMAVANTAGKVCLGLAVFFYLLAVGLAIWLSSVKV